MTQVSKDIQDELNGHRQSDKNDECFKTGETNTINFVQADGSQQMFPYSQLITAWTEHTDEENVIKIFFATHLVTIKGYNLRKIYSNLNKQLLKSLVAKHIRSRGANNMKEVFVSYISCIWKSEEEFNFKN